MTDDEDEKNPFLVVVVVVVGVAAIFRSGVRELHMGTIFAVLPRCLEGLPILEVNRVPVEAPDCDRFFVGDAPRVDGDEDVLAVIGGLKDFDRLLVAGNDRVDICVIIDNEVSSSNWSDCSVFFELVVYDANLGNKYGCFYEINTVFYFFSTSILLRDQIKNNTQKIVQISLTLFSA